MGPVGSAHGDAVCDGGCASARVLAVPYPMLLEAIGPPGGRLDMELWYPLAVAAAAETSMPCVGTGAGGKDVMDMEAHGSAAAVVAGPAYGLGGAVVVEGMWVGKEGVLLYANGSGPPPPPPPAPP